MGKQQSSEFVEGLSAGLMNPPHQNQGGFLFSLHCYIIDMYGSLRIIPEPFQTSILNWAYLKAQPACETITFEVGMVCRCPILKIKQAHRREELKVSYIHTWPIQHVWPYIHDPCSAYSRYLVCKMHNNKGGVWHARFLEVLAAAVAIVQFLCPVLVCSFWNLVKKMKKRGKEECYIRNRWSLK